MVHDGQPKDSAAVAQARGGPSPPIGVVLVLLYYLIGAGVCLLLGAVFGRTWNERHQPPGPTRSDSGTNATAAK